MFSRMLHYTHPLSKLYLTHTFAQPDLKVLYFSWGPIIPISPSYLSPFTSVKRMSDIHPTSKPTASHSHLAQGVLHHSFSGKTLKVLDFGKWD